MTTLLEAATNAASALKRIDQWLKVRTAGTGLMPAERRVMEDLEQAIADERANHCGTCKNKNDVYDEACATCCNFYANHWEPKPCQVEVLKP